MKDMDDEDRAFVIEIRDQILKAADNYSILHFSFMTLYAFAILLALLTVVIDIDHLDSHFHTESKE